MLVTQLETGYELLSGHTDLDAYGDKGYISKAVRDALSVENRIGLHCVSRRNQKEQTPPEARRLINAARQDLLKLKRLAFTN